MECDTVHFREFKFSACSDFNTTKCLDVRLISDYDRLQTLRRVGHGTKARHAKKMSGVMAEDASDAAEILGRSSCNMGLNC